MHLISDTTLIRYSYKGQKGKLRFKEFDNITNLIATAAADSIIKGEEEEDEIEACGTITDVEEKLKLKKRKFKEYKKSAETYFTKEYIKSASTRCV